MISVTGKFIFSVLLALSQYVVPYTAEQREEILKNYERSGVELKDWQKRALNFEPKNIHELIAITGDERAIAQYIRTSCIRLMSSTQSDRNIQRGDFKTMDFDLLRILASSVKIREFQDKIKSSEQDIKISQAFDYLQRACDLRYSVESIERIALLEADQVSFDPSALSTDQIEASMPYQGAMREVVEYYGKVYAELPQIGSRENLPYLPELSLVFDRKGQIIGDYSLTEYDRKYQAIIRRNRRVLTRDSSNIPKQLKNALVSVEDSNFYNHGGVDLRGALRAVYSTSSNGSVQGASTITMQLAKNLLLYKDVFTENVEGRRSLIRKLKEYILVKRLESILTKDEILELYFNTIDFGRGVQGIVFAAKVYFGKKLNELKIEEMALLAGLPKSPYGLDPLRNMQRALERRNRVLKDMLKQTYITRDQYVKLSAISIKTLPAKSDQRSDGYSMHYVNAVQKQIQDWTTTMKQNSYVGLEVTTPINHEYQRWAVESLQRGLLNYERTRKRNGKKVLTVKPDEDQLPNIREEVEALAEKKGVSTIEVFSEILKPIKNRYLDASQFSLGVILSNEKIGLKDGTQVNRQPEDRVDQLYKVVKGRKKNLEVWDVVMLEPFKKSNGGTYYKIASFTEVQGSMVVIDNKTGAVLATAGGFSVGAGGRYKGSANNRAFSALRQPGSTIKPFIYFYALNKGILQNQFLSNANVTLPEIIRREGSRLCQNWSLTDSGEAPFYSLGDGLVRSKNRLTVHAFMRASGVEEWQDPMLSQRNLEYGLYNLINMFKAFGLYKDREYFCYPVILGAHEVKAADIAGAYATIARGGGHVSPFTVTKLKLPRNGKILENPLNLVNDSQDPVAKAVVSDSVSFFKLKQMLQDVVQRGTARSISKWSPRIAGKTGTTQNTKDAWFVGFNKEITVAVWVGYPKGQTLGSKFKGSMVALPIFKDFMEQYYKAYPEKSSVELMDSVPQNLREVFVENTTGYLIDNDFRSIFSFYTGRRFNYLDNLGSVIYVTEDEHRNLSRYVHSTKAMNFFFDHLTDEKKDEIRQRMGSDSDYDVYQYNLSLCEPYLFNNGRGGRTWNPRRVSKRINQACRYIATRPRPERLAKNSVSDNDLRRYFTNNY